jgi:hypothetical protein
MLPEEHKKIAIQCFNAIWKILDKTSPTKEEELEAIRLAHTSSWHWYQCGQAVNFQRGEWICSRVYIHFNHLEEALFHAKLCYELTIEHKLTDFDLSYGFECLARVYKKMNDKENFQKYFQLLQDSLSQIKEEEDRKLVVSDIASLN